MVKTDRDWEWEPELYCRECGQRGIFTLDAVSCEEPERDWCPNCDGALAIETEFPLRVRCAKQRSDLLKRYGSEKFAILEKEDRAMRRNIEDSMFFGSARERIILVDDME